MHDAPDGKGSRYPLVGGGDVCGGLGIRLLAMRASVSAFAAGKASLAAWARG